MLAEACAPEVRAVEMYVKEVDIAEVPTTEVCVSGLGIGVGLEIRSRG